MGQPVTVVVKPAEQEGILVFELNRSITGMGHRNYFYDDIKGDENSAAKKPDTLADQVGHQILQDFGPKGVESVHINSNILTLKLAPTSTSIQEEIAESLAGIFLYYSKTNGEDK